jgi:hypothetical protein
MDYCAFCSQSLCDDCMKSGCCGSVPARSGRKADSDDADFCIEQRYLYPRYSVPSTDRRASRHPRPIDTDPV